MLRAITQTVICALSNELKVTCDRMGMKIWDIIGLCGEFPGLGPFFPELSELVPAPFSFTWAARRYGYSSRLIEAAVQVNAAMPAYVIEKVTVALNDAGKPVRGSRVTILGIVDKLSGDDPENSPGMRLMGILLEKGAIVTYNDPHMRVLPRMRQWQSPDMNSTPLSVEFLSDQDSVLIVTAHSEYDWDWVVCHSKLIIDTRNATQNVSKGREKIIHA
jgi:UDP-N-acetyl-D-glucosamine dehydrogenase